MAWEWVAPVASSAAISVGAVTTWLAAAGGRKHAEAVVRAGNEHAERMAQLERRQQRLADTYVELLEMVERTGHWASQIYPLMDTTPPQSVPPLPSEDEQIRVRARVQAYGSSEVKRIFDEYIVVVNDLRLCASIIAWEESESAGQAKRHASDERGEFGQTHRPAELKKRKELGEQVAAELS